jgi:hypothetical protein
LRHIHAWSDVSELGKDVLCVRLRVSTLSIGRPARHVVWLGPEDPAEDSEFQAKATVKAFLYRAKGVT